jgi:hypothetical protein
MWGLTFSSEVIIIISFNILIAPDSITKDLSMTCSWCMSRCRLLTGSTHVEGAIQFEVSGVPTFKALVLSSSIVSSLSGLMRIIQSSRCTGEGSGKNHKSNLLWFFDSLSKVGLRNCLDMTLNLMSDHHISFVNFVGFLQQCHGLFS